jgi:hypothetical protein
MTLLRVAAKQRAAGREIGREKGRGYGPGGERGEYISHDICAACTIL